MTGVWQQQGVISSQEAAHILAGGANARVGVVEIEMVIIDRGIGTSCLSPAPGRGVSGTDPSLLCQGCKF